MAYEEFKDVLRIEESEEGLKTKLRNKQLGFERYVGPGEVQMVRMGYKDSDGEVHYFDKSGISQGYWEPFDWGINYNHDTRNVAIGCETAKQRLQVHSASSGVQIRISYSDSQYVDMGVTGYDSFKIEFPAGNRRFEMRDYGMDIGYKDAMITSYNGHSAISSTGSLLLEAKTPEDPENPDLPEKSGKIDIKNNGTMYVKGDNAFLLDFKQHVIIDSGTNMNINVGENLGLSSGGVFNIWSKTENANISAGNILNLGAQNFVSINSRVVKIPVKNEDGHPDMVPQDGFLYVNKDERKVYLYIDDGVGNAWKTIASW